MVPDTVETLRQAYNSRKGNDKSEPYSQLVMRDRVFNYLATSVDAWRQNNTDTIVLPTTCQPLIDELIEERLTILGGEPLSKSAVIYFNQSTQETFVDVLTTLGSPQEIAALFV